MSNRSPPFKNRNAIIPDVYHGLSRFDSFMCLTCLQHNKPPYFGSLPTWDCYQSSIGSPLTIHLSDFCSLQWDRIFPVLCSAILYILDDLPELGLWQGYGSIRRRD